MDLTPQSNRSNTKSASRLKISNSAIDSKQEPRWISPDLANLSPKNNISPSPSPRPLRELLLLSPSPLKKSRTRLAERLEMAAEEVSEPAGPRKRCKSKGGQQKSVSNCGSPRNTRRSRRRSEMEMKDEKEMAAADEVAKPRKRRTTVRSKKEKLNLAPSLPSPSTSQKDEDVGNGDLCRIGEIINDLVMWRDVAKSTLWFGLGCLCFLSSCFSKGVNFSVFSITSQLGLLFLGASFISNSICQRNSDGKKQELKLRDDDIDRIVRRILPATNFVISKTRELFSGDPSTTLKVMPFLLLGAEYGQLITLWRLCAFGFFVGFTVPKLYSCHASRITQKAENMKLRIVEAWGTCSHKKIVGVSAVSAFWNLTSIKTRIFTVFIFLVIIRYKREYQRHDSVEVEAVEETEELPEQKEEAKEMPEATEGTPEAMEGAKELPEQKEEEEEAMALVVAETIGSKKP